LKKQKIKIGTRGSQLALYQANAVKDAINTHLPHIETEIVIIKTKGDIILDVALSKIGDKGLFTKELEVELYNKTIDVAVHSLKDLPTTFPDGLMLGGVLERGEIRDALVHKDGKTFAELDDNDVVATSSLRRRAQLLMRKPGLKIVDIRGNVNTRLKKMENGHCTAMIMAAAGLKRIGLGHLITEVLDPVEFIPAVSQGAIAMETRADDPETSDVMQSITHDETLQAVLAERTFLRLLEGGCQVPIGCYSKNENGVFSLKGFVSDLDGQTVISEEMSSKPANAKELAEKMAKAFLSRGAAEILEKIRKENL
jgi:hydroxymethylbilane synthase